LWFFSYQTILYGQPYGNYYSTIPSLALHALDLLFGERFDVYGLISNHGADRHQRTTIKPYVIPLAHKNIPKRPHFLEGIKNVVVQRYIGV
jgi:hypothetical protein